MRFFWALVATAALHAHEAIFLKKDTSAIRVACLGDSITLGIWFPKEQSYPGRLQKLLGSGYVVGNFGRGFASLMPPKAEYFVEYENTTEFQDALEFRPNIVVLMLGTNDVSTGNGEWTEKKSEVFVKHYSSLIGRLRSLYPPPRIHINIPPPCYKHSNPDSEAACDEKANDELPRLIRRIAKDNHLGLPIDTFGLFRSHCPKFSKGKACNWMSDGFVHPNPDGYFQIASLVYYHLLYPTGDGYYQDPNQMQKAAEVAYTNRTHNATDEERQIAK